MSVIKGLDNLLGGKVEFMKFEEGKPATVLFIDWEEDVIGVYEHYDKALTPKYIRCPGKEVCPYCKMNPDKYPSLRVKFRVYDPTDNKVKLVSMAKTHVAKLNTEFKLDEIDPRNTYVTIYRTGKGASDTSYSSRVYRPDPQNGKPEYPMPNLDELDMPSLEEHTTPHTPEQIQGFMDALLQGYEQSQENVTSSQEADQQAPEQANQPQTTGRKLPF